MKKKKLISVIISAFVLIIASAIIGIIAFSADEPTIVDQGTCGESAYWKLDDEGTLTIYGSGEMEDYRYYSPEMSPWRSINQELNRVIIEEGITTIGDWAFYKCDTITNVSMPESVTSIGICSFEECESLNSIYIPSNVNSIGSSSFNFCSSVSEIIVSEQNETFDSRNNCNAVIETKSNSIITGCKNTIIPENIISIGSGAFEGCKSLTSIIIPDGIKEIKLSAFSNCTNLISIDIPGTVEIIQTHAFNNCTSLSSVAIQEGVITIGSSMFYGCKALTSVSLPNSIKKINNDAFYMCTELSSINLPINLTTIGYEAFWSCDSLTSIYIPKNVESIGRNPFGGCDSLSEIIVSEDNKYYDSRNNCNAIIYSNDNHLVCGCMNTIIPNTITSIGDDAFCGCKSIYSILIPTGVTYIGNEAFSCCTNLRTIIIPDSVTHIGKEAFRLCSSLENVYIPSTVEVIDNSGFYGTFDKVKNITYTGPLAGAPWGANNLNGYNADGIFTYLDETKTTIVHCDENYEGVVTVPEGVTRIENYAFSNCKKLTGIVFPESLFDIGYDALYNSSIYNDEANWENDILYYGNIAFKVRGTGTTYSVKDGTRIITDKLFENRYDVTDIALPQSLEAVGKKAFYDCKGLRNPTLPSTIKQVGDSAFTNVNNVNYLGSLSTSYWGALNYNGKTDGIFTYIDEAKKNLIGCASNASGKVIVPDTVETISSFAFYGCNDITEISLPFVGASRNAEGTAANYGYVFGYTDDQNSNAFVPSSIKKVEITDADYIAEGAFKDCDNIEELTLQFVGKNADATGKEGCFGYIFGTTETASDGYTEQKYSDTESTFCAVTASLKKITITEDGTVPYGAFYGLENIESITLSDSTKSIGKNSAYGTAIYNNISNWNHKMLCLNGNRFVVAYDETKFQSFVSKVPADAVLISDYCFENATIKNIALSLNLEYIGKGAFQNCGSLRNVTGAEKLKAFGEDAFSGCSSLAYFEMPSSVEILPNSVFDSNLENLEILYDSTSADWKKLNAYFDDATVYYTLRSDNENAIVIYCDDDVRFDAGNVDVKKVSAKTVDKAESKTFNYQTSSGFYEYRDAVPYGIFDIKLYNTNNEEIQPESGHTVTLKIKASDGFRTMLLGSLKNFNGEFEDITITDGDIYYSASSKTPECTTDEVITDRFLRLIHFYSEKFEGAVYKSYDIKDITLEDGYFVLDIPHFSEFSVVGKEVESSERSMVVGDLITLDVGGADVTNYSFSVNGVVTEQSGKIYGNSVGEVTVTAWNGTDVIKTFVITVNPCTCNILNYQKERTVDYKTTMKFHYDGNKPENAKAVWYINGERYAEVDEITVSTPTDDFNVEVRIVTASGIICSETEKVKVKHGFFDKISWFFKNLFSKKEAIIDQK